MGLRPEDDYTVEVEFLEECLTERRGIRAGQIPVLKICRSIFKFSSH